MVPSANGEEPKSLTKRLRNWSSDLYASTRKRLGLERGGKRRSKKGAKKTVKRRKQKQDHT
jgi:hypothetical protein